MKAKLLVGMLCLGLLGFTACDKEEVGPTPDTAGISSTNDDNAAADPQSNEEVGLEDNSGMLDGNGGRMADERDANGKYFISYFENGTPTGGIDVTSQYDGFVFTIENRTLTVTGNGVHLTGVVRIDEDRSLLEMHLPYNEKLSDIDPVWMLNDLTDGMIAVASVGMDAPRDGMILTKVPEPRVAPKQRQ